MTECQDGTNYTIQTYLLDMIDIIGQRLEITEINKKAEYVISTLSSRLQLIQLLDNIESFTSSLLQNITDGVDSGIIARRIEYFRQLLAELPDDAQAEYSAIGGLILEVLSMISDGIDVTIVTKNITTIKDSLSDETAMMDIIDEIQTVFCSIIQNITDGVDSGIIGRRIEYVRQLISTIPCS
jgi:phage-related protein